MVKLSKWLPVTVLVPVPLGKPYKNVLDVNGTKGRRYHMHYPETDISHLSCFLCVKWREKWELLTLPRD